MARVDTEQKLMIHINRFAILINHVFISNRIKTENFSNTIYVKVDRVQDKDKTFDAEKTLKQDGVHD